MLQPMRTFCLFAALSLPLISGVEDVANTDPWPMMLQDPQHSALLAKSLTLSAAVPPLKWTYKAGGEIESSPIVGKKYVFFAAGKEILAVDKVSGKRVWRTEAEQQVVATGALGGGAFMVGSDDHNFYALDQETGNLLWKFKAGEFTGGATVGLEDDTVYVGSNADALHAYFLNGTKRYDFKTGGNVASTPALDGTGVYFGDDSGVFYKLDRSSGKKAWSASFGSNIRSPAKLDPDGIFIGIGDPDDSKSGEIIRLNYDGSVRWRATCDGKKSKCDSCWTSPAVVGGVVIAGCGLDSKRRGFVWGVDKETGALLWKFEAKDDCQTSSPVVVGDAVVLGCIDGNLYALRAVDGKLIWHFKSPKGIWATPALDYDGTIFVGSHSGHLYALGGDTKSEL